MNYKIKTILVAVIIALFISILLVVSRPDMIRDNPDVLLFLIIFFNGIIIFGSIQFIMFDIVRVVCKSCGRKYEALKKLSFKTELYSCPFCMKESQAEPNNEKDEKESL